MEQARKSGKPIEVEVRTRAEVEEALSCGASRILLDNMTPDEAAIEIGLINHRAETEISGGITLAERARVCRGSARFHFVGRDHAFGAAQWISTAVFMPFDAVSVRERLPGRANRMVPECEFDHDDCGASGSRWMRFGNHRRSRWTSRGHWAPRPHLALGKLRRTVCLDRAAPPACGARLAIGDARSWTWNAGGDHAESPVSLPICAGLTTY